MGNQSYLGQAQDRLNLETDLLAGEGGRAGRQSPFVSDTVKWMGQSVPVFSFIYTQFHIIINPKGWYLELKWGVNSKQF